MTFEIKPFDPIYTNQIKEVVQRGLLDTGVISEEDVPLDDEDLDKISTIYGGRGQFWVALAGGKVIGTIALKDMGDNRAKLKRMFVLKRYHGKGIGQALLDQALAFAKAQGFSQVELNSHLNMERAHNFYQKNGFTKYEKKNDAYYFKKVL